MGREKIMPAQNYQMALLLIQHAREHGLRERDSSPEVPQRFLGDDLARGTTSENDITSFRHKFGRSERTDDNARKKREPKKLHCCLHRETREMYN